MASLNKVLLIGNLTRDPELRYTPQGTAVANLRLAVNRRFKSKTNELKEETCFITAVVWNKMAESCNQFLHKGSPVFIEGRLQSRSWEDTASGKNRTVIEVRAERVQFLGKAEKGSAGGAEASMMEEHAGEVSTEQAWLDEESEERVDDSNQR
jgi:single-strand DNA-binding protein